MLYLGDFLILPGLDAEALADRFATARAGRHDHRARRRDPRPGRLPRPPCEPSCPRPTSSCRTPTRPTLILGETDPVRQALAFRDLGARRVVITRGEHGAVAVSGRASASASGTYPVPFVDGTGGGDAFDAGYIAGLLDGLDELDCLKLASAVGASCVRAVGTTAGVFTRPEADAFVRQHELTVTPL